MHIFDSRKHCNLVFCFVNWIFPFIVICYITGHSSIPHCMGHVFCCIFLVEFLYVNVPHFSIISVRLQINKYLHVCKYVKEKAKLHFKKKEVGSVYILSHIMIWHFNIKIYKRRYNFVLYRLIFVCFPSFLKDLCYLFQLSHLQAVVV